MIPTYNRKDLLAECLRGLLRQTRPLDEIVVIDNASTDNTEDKVRAEFGASVTYLRLAENTGSAGGFHEGIKLAYEHGHDWIWCMDNDAIPLEDTLQKLLDAESPSAGHVVAKACWHTDPLTGEGRPGSVRVDFNKGRYLYPNPADCSGRVIPVDCAPWAGLLISSEVIPRAGFPKVDMFSWADDHAFCLELRKFGEILLVGTTTLYHPGLRSRVATVKRLGRDRVRIEEYWKVYYGTRNKLYVGRLYFKSQWRTVLKFLASYMRGLLSILLLDDFKLYRVRILTRGFVDGFTGRLGKRVHPNDFRGQQGSRTPQAPTAP